MWYFKSLYVHTPELASHRCRAPWLSPLARVRLSHERDNIVTLVSWPRSSVVALHVSLVTHTSRGGVNRHILCMSPLLSPTQTQVSMLSMTILVTADVMDTDSNISPATPIMSTQPTHCHMMLPAVMLYIFTVMSMLDVTTRAP